MNNKKWIVAWMVGGSMSALVLSGTMGSAQEAVTPVDDVDPCPACCPPEICGYNGPSFDGTTDIVPVKR